MNISKEGLLEINDKKYKYKLINTDDLIEIIRHKPKFTTALESAIRLYRGNPDFKIFDLIKEYIYYRPDSDTHYFIVYKNNEIISTARLYYYKEKQYGYINMVYTNESYRGQGICKKGIEFLINKTSKYINTYELEVLVDNLPAIKCYEYNGFKFIKKMKFTQINKKGEKKIKYYNLMRLKN